MKRITTARVREYALLPVTAGRAVALATVPTMMFCLSPLSRAMADDYFDGDEVQALLQEAVATLPEVQRAVFCLRYYDEMKYAEMSNLLEKSEG